MPSLCASVPEYVLFPSTAKPESINNERDPTAVALGSHEAGAPAVTALKNQSGSRQVLCLRPVTSISLKTLRFTGAGDGSRSPSPESSRCSCRVAEAWERKGGHRR